MRRSSRRSVVWTRRGCPSARRRGIADAFGPRSAARLSATSGLGRWFLPRARTRVADGKLGCPSMEVHGRCADAKRRYACSYSGSAQSAVEQCGTWTDPRSAQPCHHRRSAKRHRRGRADSAPQSRLGCHGGIHTTLASFAEHRATLPPIVWSRLVVRCSPAASQNAAGPDAPGRFQFPADQFWNLSYGTPA